MDTILNILKQLFTSFLNFGKSNPTTTPQNGNLVGEIQQLTVSFCGFLPMAESVMALLSASFPGVAAPLNAADQVARSICQAASQAKPAVVEAAMLGTWQQPQEIIVNGVPVTGTWVK